MLRIVYLPASVLLVITLALYGITVGVATAHNGEVHEETHTSKDMAIMQQIVKHMQEVVALYTQKAALLGVSVSATAHDNHHEDDSESGLQVWVELHSNKTHVHVVLPDGDADSYLFEDLKYTQEDEIIAATAEKTGLSAHDIKKVITFPSGEVDAHGDSIDHEDGDEDIAGIHIMSDGTIMWGNGTPVAGATVTSDGHVKLHDGRIIEPKFDLR